MTQYHFRLDSRVSYKGLHKKMHQDILFFQTVIGWTLEVFLISNVSGTDIVIADVRQPKHTSVRATAPASSFCVAYLRGKMEGQSPDRDMFNKQIDHPLRKIKL